VVGSGGDNDDVLLDMRCKNDSAGVNVIMEK